MGGGEFLLADRAGFSRLDHFPVVPMAGSEMAVREPWRMAAAHLQGLDYSGLDWWRHRRPAEQKAVQALLAHPDTPRTSSLGRGGSANLFTAFERARQMGVATIALARSGGGRLSELKLDHLYTTPSHWIPRIQEAHATLAHTLWHLVHQSL